MDKESGFSPSLTDVEIEQYLEEVMNRNQEGKN